MKLGITMLIHYKDDIQFVTEFPCFLGHSVLHIIQRLYIVFSRKRLNCNLSSNFVWYADLWTHAMQFVSRFFFFWGYLTSFEGIKSWMREGCRGAVTPALMNSEPPDFQNYLQALQNRLRPSCYVYGLCHFVSKPCILISACQFYFLFTFYDLTNQTSKYVSS